MTHQLIVDMKEGTEIQQYFVVRQVEERLTKERESVICSWSWATGAGHLAANLWSNMLQEFPGPFQVGDYVGVVGQVDLIVGIWSLKCRESGL